MQIANASLRLNDHTELPPQEITPPEALVLQTMHGRNAGGQVIVGMKIGKNISRGNAEELARLKAKYGSPVVKELFPGAAPSLPQTFAQAGFNDDGTVQQEEEPEPPKAPAAPKQPAKE